MIRRRYSLVVCLFVSQLLVSACGYDEMWDGVEYEHDGLTLTMAATEPLCGCLRISNKSSAPIYIRSFVSTGRELGNLTLAPGEMTAAHFDWAGASGNTYFILETWNDQGQQLKAQDVLTINETGFPWKPCVGSIPGQEPPEECPLGPLKLNTGRTAL